MELSKAQRITFIRRTKDVSADIYFDRSPSHALQHVIKHATEEGGIEKEYSYFYTPIDSRIAPDDSVYNFPFLLHKDGRPWKEGNMYLWHLASDFKKLGSETDAIQTTATYLLDYLIFCEEQGIDYLDFSQRRAVNRPSYRYFNDMVDSGRVAAGSINLRTGKVYYFFEWLFKQPGYENDIDRVDMAQDYTHFFDTATGSGSVERKKRNQTVSVSKESTPVSSGKVRDEGEDLRPLTTGERRELIDILKRDEFSVDERLIAQIALYTGVRKQTVLTLRMKHLSLFKPEALIQKDRTYRVTAGPGTGIDTKFDRKYTFYIPQGLAEELEVYANSSVAKKRRAKYQDEYAKAHPDLEPMADEDVYIFISEQGNCHYMAKNDPRYKVMRKDSRPKGKRTDVLCKKIERFASEDFPKDFVFHWLRATYALRYYETLIKIEEYKVEQGLQDRPRRFDMILRDVMVRLCHRDIKVTQSYLNLFENFDERQEAQNAFEDFVFRDFDEEFNSTGEEK